MEEDPEFMQSGQSLRNDQLVVLMFSNLFDEDLDRVVLDKVAEIFQSCISCKGLESFHRVHRQLFVVFIRHETVQQLCNFFGRHHHFAESGVVGHELNQCIHRNGDGMVLGVKFCAVASHFQGVQQKLHLQLSEALWVVESQTGDVVNDLILELSRALGIHLADKPKRWRPMRFAVTINVVVLAVLGFEMLPSVGAVHHRIQIHEFGQQFIPVPLRTALDKLQRTNHTLGVDGAQHSDCIQESGLKPGSHEGIVIVEHLPYEAFHDVCDLLCSLQIATTDCQTVRLLQVAECTSFEEAHDQFRISCIQQQL
mmetsp:Transcript_43099/g.63179  ORF Transcript_43099/g.63179 Transcript_43099/m.63179 type:complete len:311 (-) Transcript_43099:163-1095(-)